MVVITMSRNKGLQAALVSSVFSCNLMMIDCINSWELQAVSIVKN